jgi:hypothetical protein
MNTSVEAILGSIGSLQRKRKEKKAKAKVD